MSGLKTITGIARYEAKLLLRSWGFRVFSGLALVALTSLMVTVVMPSFGSLYFIRTLSGAFPALVIKLLNVFQGIMAVFLATEFLKRDRKQDTSQVIFAHPFSNGEYVLGKFLGILSVFALLDAAVLAIAVAVHAFFSQAPFSLAPYLLYVVLVSLPTLLFIIGLSLFLGTLIRSQAMVTLIVLSYVFISLAIAGSRPPFAWDGFAFSLPVMYSDVLGLGNLGPLVQIRGAYALLGLALVMASAVLMKRLRQSPGWTRVLGLLSVFSTVLALLLGYAYLSGMSSGRGFREALRMESRIAADSPAMTLLAADLRVRHAGGSIDVAADLTLGNRSRAALKTVFLSLNPGLRIVELKGPAGNLPFQRKQHLVILETEKAIEPGEDIRLSISYSGTIDERYCYPDIDETRRATPLKIWLLSVPQRYAAISPNFVHLTPESGWYPRPGLPEALTFPARVGQDFSRYTLRVEVPEGLTAVSQGIPTIEGAGPEKTYIFQPQTFLPQLSLTIGPYDRQAITVDGVQYGLFLFRGHDRFTAKFNEIAEELPQLIRQLRDGYEVGLGLSYPYRQLSLVELPIQMAAYGRLWTTAQENLQPEIVFLSEMGVLNSGAEFRAGRGFGPAGQGAIAQMAGRMGRGEFSPKDIQRQNFNRFVQSNLMGTQTGIPMMARRGPLGVVVETNSEARFEIFPQFLAFTSNLDISEWPLLGYAMEAYLRERAAPAVMAGIRGALGDSGREETNRFLIEYSLADLLRNTLSLSAVPVSSVLEEKGKYLMTLIRARLGVPDFDDRLVAFLKSRRFQPITRQDLEGFVAPLGSLDLGQTITAWSLEKGLPGFLVDAVETYPVVDGEKTRYQVKFRVANPTDREGVLKVNFVTRGGFGGRPGGGGAMPAATDNRVFYVPAGTVKQVGFVLDQAAVMTIIDTTMSQNLPASFTLPFSAQRAAPGVRPFEGETAGPYVPPAWGADGEYVVDNEDPGFKRPDAGRANWLRRSLQKAFVIEEAGAGATGVPMIMNPPDSWQPIILQSFFGGFVRSAYMKKSGAGASKVAWEADLEQSGDYDIYFYHEGFGGRMGRGGMPGQGGATQRGAQPGQGPQAERMNPGKKYFLVSFEGGSEEVVVDIRNAPSGWNLIGNFRLAAGLNKVELTDKSEGRYVLADAVKWVFKK